MQESESYGVSMREHGSVPKGRERRVDRRIKTADRTARALELRRSGATYEEIAQACGYRSRSEAFQSIQRALSRVIEEPAQALREIEGQRLDAMQQAIWDKAMTGDLPAIDRMLRLMERRAKLFGLDTPTKIAPTDPSGEAAYGGGEGIEEARSRVATMLAKIRVYPQSEMYGSGDASQQRD